MRNKKNTYLGVLGFIILGVALSSQDTVCALPSPHPVDYYEAGTALLENYQGDDLDLTHANRHFITLIEDFPDCPLGYIGLSRACIIQAYRFENHHQMSQIRDESLPLAVKALELGPLLPDVHITYSAIQEIFDRHSQNQAIAQKYLELLPEEPETFYLLGIYLMGQDDFTESVQYLETALKMEPDAALKFKILKRLGYIQLQYFDHPQKAVTYFNQAAELIPNEPSLEEYLSRALIENGQYQAAVEELLDSPRGYDSPMTKYLQLVAKGYLKEEEGCLDQALLYFERAVGLNPERDTKLYYHLGNLYFRLKNFNRAFQHFKRVIALRPYDYSDIYFLAGRSAHLLGDDASALDYFRKYLQSNDDGQEAEWIRKNIPNLSHK